MYRSFFFNDTATTEIYTLSLHDALPISARDDVVPDDDVGVGVLDLDGGDAPVRDHVRVVLGARSGAYAVGGIEVLQLVEDRKSTRLNSSHANISYAVFCLKKKNHTRGSY